MSKCAFTKEEIKGGFSVRQENGKNKYFKNEYIYNLYVKNSEAESKIQEKVNDILGVYKLAQLPIAFRKKLTIWKKEYKELAILYAINGVESELYTNKDKGINYLIAIIDNNLFKGNEIFLRELNPISEEFVQQEELHMDLYENIVFKGNRTNILKFY